jgi:hypothetical protein
MALALNTPMGFANAMLLVAAVKTPDPLSSPTLFLRRGSTGGKPLP